MNLVGLGDECVTFLASFKSELSQFVKVPKTVYVASGEIPWDEESLTLNLGTLNQGRPGAPSGQSYEQPSMLMTSVTLYVQLLRKVSTVGPQGAGNRLNIPSQEKMNQEGVRAFNDVGALYQTAINLKAQNVPVPLGVDFAIGQAVPLGPMGGMAAVRLPLEFVLGTS